MVIILNASFKSVVEVQQLCRLRTYFRSTSILRASSRYRRSCQAFRARYTLGLFRFARHEDRFDRRVRRTARPEAHVRPIHLFLRGKTGGKKARIYWLRRATVTYCNAYKPSLARVYSSWITQVRFIAAFRVIVTAQRD